MSEANHNLNRLCVPGMRMPGTHKAFHRSTLIFRLFSVFYFVCASGCSNINRFWPRTLLTWSLMIAFDLFADWWTRGANDGLGSKATIGN